MANKPPSDQPKQTPKSAGPVGAAAVTMSYDYLVKALADERATKWVLLVLLAFSDIIGLPGAYYSGKERPHVTAVNSFGQVFELPELSEAAATDTEIASFCEEAVPIIGTFGYTDYDQRLKEMRPYFDDDGYKSYVTALDAYSTKAAMEKSLQAYATRPSTNCKLQTHGHLPDGRFGWTVTISAKRLVYAGSNVPVEKNLSMTFDIARTGGMGTKYLWAIHRTNIRED